MTVKPMTLAKAIVGRSLNRPLQSVFRHDRAPEFREWLDLSNVSAQVVTIVDRYSDDTATVIEFDDETSAAMFALRFGLGEELL